MKRIIVLLFFVGFLSSVQTLEAKTKIAIAVYMDTVFTVYGFDDVRSYEVDLSKDFYKLVANGLDSSTFSVVEKKLPSSIPKKYGLVYPRKRRYLPWLTELKEKEGIDYVVVLGKPAILPQSPYNYLSGYSYGMTTVQNLVFSMNTAYIIDTQTAKVVGECGMQHSMDFITQLDKEDRFYKPFDQFTVEDTKKAQALIIKFNQAFARNVRWEIFKLIQ